MRIRLFCFLLFVIITSSVLGQDTTAVNTTPVKYWNTFLFGTLSPDSEKTMTASITTIHGFTFRKWRIGVGTGVEGYEGWRTIPFFGSLSFDFGKIKDNKLYLQLNMGSALGKKLEKIEGVINEDERGALMFNPMVGYRISTNKLSICLAAGYKLQQLEYEFDGYWGWQYGHHTISEEFNRFMLQMGIGIR